MKRLIRGGLAGIVATGIMTLVILAGKATGLLRTPPPKQITRNVGESAGADPEQAGGSSFTASWLLAHAGYGATLGALYTLIHPALPRDRSTAGLLFGMGVWASNYAGLLPLLGLYPTPAEDSNSRQAVMIAAHAVYGITLAATAGRK